MQIKTISGCIRNGNHSNYVGLWSLTGINSLSCVVYGETCFPRKAFSEKDLQACEWIPVMSHLAVSDLPLSKIKDCKWEELVAVEYEAIIVIGVIQEL